MPKAPTEDEKYYYSQMAKQCKAIGTSDGQESCRPVSAEHVDWEMAYHSMVELGLWDLPDQSTLPKPDRSEMIMDGLAMLVELRAGEDYRAYVYSNPGFSNAPEAHKATKIMGIAGGGIGRVEIR